MAPVHGSKARVYANGYDLSAYLRTVSVSGVRDAAETSAFADSAKTYIYGLKDATLTAEGMYDGSTAAVHDQMTAAIGGTTLSEWTVLPSGASIGNKGWAVQTHETSYEVSSPVDEVCMIAVEGQSSVGLEPIACHQAFGTVTASGTAASVVDNAAGSNGGGFGYLHASFTGAGTAVVVIQHSTDDVTYSDLITFSNLSGTAVSSERATSSGTVNRYTRSIHTITGAGTLVFTDAFGRG